MLSSPSTSSGNQDKDSSEHHNPPLLQKSMTMDQILPVSLIYSVMLLQLSREDDTDLQSQRKARTIDLIEQKAEVMLSSRERYNKFCCSMIQHIACMQQMSSPCAVLRLTWVPEAFPGTFSAHVEIKWLQPRKHFHGVHVNAIMKGCMNIKAEQERDE